MDFVYFLGRFHVLALHIPIGVIMAVALLEILARYQPRFASLKAASPYLWGVAAASAIATVVLGFMHYTEGGFDGPSVPKHMFFGVVVAVVATVGFAMALKAEQLFAKAAVPLSVALVVLVSITGHYGGNLTHGSTYLVEYAPQFIRSMHGLEPRRARVTDLATADPYLDVIKPLTDLRCLSCHNDDRRRGELSMVDHESLMSGGEFLPVIVPYAPDASSFIQRISLPEDDDDFMPADGNTPLTERQTQIFAWWVAAGAPAGVTFAEIELDPEAEALIRAELGLE